MSKAKWRDGYLCRDDEPDGDIVFFWDVSFPPVKRGTMWVLSPDEKDMEKFGMRVYDTLKNYHKDYSLKPPAPGEMFEVEVEL